MKVVATRLGWYGMRRRYPAEMSHKKGAGAPFELNDPKDFSPKWMRVVEDDAGKAVGPAPAPAPAPVEEQVNTMSELVAGKAKKPKNVI